MLEEQPVCPYIRQHYTKACQEYRYDTSDNILLPSAAQYHQL
jgi:hypothetical protein